MDIKLLRKFLILFVAICGWQMEAIAQTNATPILNAQAFGFEDQGDGTYAWEDWADGVAGFSTATGTIPSTSDNAFVSGSRSVISTFAYNGASTTGDAQLNTYFGPDGDFQIEAGNYYFSAWVYIVDEGPNKIQLSIDADDISGMSNYNAINISGVGINTWTQIGTEITIDPGDDDAWMRIQYFDFPASGTGSIYLDDIELELIDDGIFDNGDVANSNWSNGLNWNGSRVVTGIASLAGSPVLDATSSIENLSTGFEVADYSITSPGDFALTINGSSDVRLIDPNIDGVLTIDCDIDLNLTAGKITTSTDVNNQLIFAQGKTVTLSERIVVENNNAVNPIIFNGDLISNGKSIFVFNGSNSTANGAIEFSNTADNTGFLSEMRVFKDDIVSNIIGPKLFMPSGGVFKFQDGTAGASATLTLNGKNSFEGVLNSADGENTVVFNADQTNMGLLKLANTSTSLTFELASSVTEVVFSSTEGTWIGTLNIVGFKNWDIKIGGTALTTAQLSAITIDGATPTNPIIQVNGYLVYDNVAGIEDYQQLEGVNIYPNPTSSQLNIECPYGSEVGIYNLMGVKVKSVSNAEKSFRLPVAELSSGLYIVKVQSDGKFYSKKIQVK
ncbi:T9SS type A sorting domain-containing protein [uncultured Lutibacter sp.]|uniref:T9SS type A sorting domain-containing protein n=1 Tax=uncultured Lutibacter sp. TaxID=437739 RepID=UPI0026181F4E|nr:T9SS type A sorting domain-containing protein [uncultured Lutibacter sp.]